MFRRLVAIEPVRLMDEHMETLRSYAVSSTFHDDVPKDNEEIIRRIGAADCVLLSYTSRIDGEVLAACPGIRYIGMCCSLYSPESANVDILTARERGIQVSGVRDYGDEGVVEYVISELVRLLHGFGPHKWREQPMELTGIPVGILGLGTTGALIARGLGFFGAQVFYFSRTRKPDLERSHQLAYLPLEDLLPRVDILCTCLNKNVVLLHEREFAAFGDGKILLNTSIGPSHDVRALAKWLTRPGNYVMGDTAAAIDPAGELLERPNVICVGQSSGFTSLACKRLGEKVIANIQAYLVEG